MLSAIHKLFNDPFLRKLFLKLRVVLILGLLALLAYFAQPAWLWPAFAVSMVGELIQVWSFGSLVKNEELTARGPYVLVRNPMYLGRFFMMLGFILLPGNLWLAAVFAVLYYFYMVNRVAREEQRLAAALGEPYRRYCAEVNRFVPRLAGLSNPNLWYLRGEVLVRNNGQWNLLATLIMWAAVAAVVLYLR